MPIRIDITEGKSEEYRTQVGNIVYQTLMDALSAQESRIKHPSREGKPFEEECQSIHVRL